MFVSGVPGIKPIVGAVVENSVAFHAGLRADDEIVAVPLKSKTCSASNLINIDASRH